MANNTKKNCKKWQTQQKNSKNSKHRPTTGKKLQKHGQKWPKTAKGGINGKQNGKNDKNSKKCPKTAKSGYTFQKMGKVAANTNNGKNWPKYQQKWQNQEDGKNSKKAAKTAKRQQNAKK